MTMGKISHGDPVTVPAAVAARAVQGRTVVDLGHGVVVFCEFVEPQALQAFLDRPINAEARVLPVRVTSSGQRYRSWESLANESRQEGSATGLCRSLAQSSGVLTS